MNNLPWDNTEPVFDAHAASGHGQNPPQDSRDNPPLTISAVAGLVQKVLAAGLPARLRVIGEVSNFSGRQHWFFSLKDEKATLSCVCFASSAKRVGFPVADGLQVIATGRIDFYDAQGRLQLYVEKLEPVGQGELELRFRALCEELRKAGYFDPANKQPLPAMPRCVAVVTSRNAAALQDVIHTAARRWAGCRLMLFDVRVQGDGAAGQIAAAIRALSDDAQRLGIEAIILTRGGGSIEDLWAFNERVVADAVFDCRLPIVAAIGHETDTTIAELVADVRCATPTQAAMTLIPDQEALEHQVHQLSGRLMLLLKRAYESSQQRLGAATRHRIFRRPQSMLEMATHRLDHLAQRLDMGLPRSVKVSRDRLESLTARLEGVGPMNVLKRGYSYTLGPEGKIIRRARDAAPGDRLTTVLAQGRLQSEVISTEGKTSRPTKKHPARKKKKTTPQPPNLFGDS